MCGIYGEFSLKARIPKTGLNIRRMLGLMSRRGPDDSGIWSAQDGRLVLGFRRLSILDLSPAGHQPMVTGDGRFVLVYNGEIYNFRELRRELRQEGGRFRSTGDTEVVLQALVQWGVAALGRFNGMFALGFYDTNHQRLLLARDHAGIKPLYYLRCPDGLIFGSQYDQILNHPWGKRAAVRPEALGLYLRLGYLPAPFALLEGSAMLEPGTWLEMDADGALRHGEYFRFPRNSVPDLHGTEADEAVAAAVSAAVKRQMVSDVPVGVFLSGGIDSPLVAAEARRFSNGPIRAFTIGVPGDAMDESADASQYAREMGLDHDIEEATDELDPGLLLDAVAACAEPFADYSVIPTLMVSRAARRHVKVVLSGDGGDELFWGYAGRFASVLHRADGFKYPRLVRMARWGLRKHLHVRGGRREHCWPSIGAWYQAKHTRVPEHWLQRLFPTLPSWPSDFSLFDFNGSDPDETAQWLRWNEFVGHLTMVLQKVDRASMYHSLEVRVPLLDREVIDIAARVDWRSCLKPGPNGQDVGKLPLRRALARHVTHQSHAKKGFGVPMGRWLRGPLREVFESEVLSRDELVGLPLDRAAARSMFDRHLSDSADYGWGLWVLLSLSMWERNHGDRGHSSHSGSVAPHLGPGGTARSSR